MRWPYFGKCFIVDVDPLLVSTSIIFKYVQYVVNRITNQQARFLREWYTGILLENVTNDALAT